MIRKIRCRAARCGCTTWLLRDSLGVLCWPSTGVLRVEGGPIERVAVCSDVAFTPDGTRVVAVGMQMVRIWDVASGVVQDAFDALIARVRRTASPFRPTGNGCL